MNSESPNPERQITDYAEVYEVQSQRRRYKFKWGEILVHNPRRVVRLPRFHYVCTELGDVYVASNFLHYIDEADEWTPSEKFRESGSVKDVVSKFVVMSPPTVA